jgi:hypothetical protein
MNDRKLHIIIFLGGFITGLFIFKSCDMIDKRLTVQLREQANR